MDPITVTVTIADPQPELWPNPNGPEPTEPPETVYEVKVSQPVLGWLDGYELESKVEGLIEAVVTRAFEQTLQDALKQLPGAWTLHLDIATSPLVDHGQVPSPATLQ